MILDLNDAASIAAWYRVWPERHGSYLADWAQRHPRFAGPIAEAGRLLREERRAAAAAAAAGAAAQPA